MKIQVVRCGESCASPRCQEAVHTSREEREKGYKVESESGDSEDDVPAGIATTLG